MMKQEFNSDPLQYLMIFLREQPPDGIDRFQNQVINDASVFAEGSSHTYSFSDCIEQDTKVKVLVTGDIELNDKNVFIGLKMAFPEWDFQHYPLNIQKLFLKRPPWTEAKEVGVLATIERIRSTGDSKWGLPCVIDLSPQDQKIDISSLIEEDLPSSHVNAPPHKTSSESQVDLFGDFISKMSKNEKQSTDVYEEITFDLDPEPTEYEPTQDDATEITPDITDPSSFNQAPINNKDIFKEEFLTGADSEEVLKDVEEVPKASPFLESDEEEPFDFSFLEDASTFSLPFDEKDLEERTPPKETFHTPPFFKEEEDFLFKEDEEFLSAHHHESEVEFELEGTLEEVPDQQSQSSSNLPTIDEVGEIFSLEGTKETVGHVFSILSDRLKLLPLRKISLILAGLGVVLVLLSYGVTIFEPDYEANKNAAGVTDLYGWIIMNDLARTDMDTDDLFALWEDSAEYRQFWYWFDYEWTPKISVYKRIESTLGTIGGFLLVPGILLLLIPVLSRAFPFVNEENADTYTNDNTNKISLGFTTYTNDWSIVDTWAKKTHFKILEVEGDRRLYRKRSGVFQAPILCLISRVEDQVQVEVWVSTCVPTMLIPLLSDLGFDVLEDKDGIIPPDVKEAINKLLIQLGHPPLA